MADDETVKDEPATEPVHEEPHHVAAEEVHHVSRSEFDSLRTSVDELTSQVQDLTQRGEQDTTPVRKPWTHRGSR